MAPAGIALQLYTLRQQAKDGFVAMLNEAAAAGYQAVEFAGYGGMPPETLRSVIDGLGIRAISSHVAFERFVAEPSAVIVELTALGCAYAVVPGLPSEFRGRDALPRVVAMFDNWGRACREAGLRFGYHNHGWELAVLDDTTFLDKLAAHTDPALVDLQIDLYWALTAGADPAILLRRYAGRTPTLHAKELAPGPEPRDTTIGDGVTPWPELLVTADEAGVEWVIVEQEDDPANAYRDIRRSLANLRALPRGGTTTSPLASAGD